MPAPPARAMADTYAAVQKRGVPSAGADGAPLYSQVTPRGRRPQAPADDARRSQAPADDARRTPPGFGEWRPRCPWYSALRRPRAPALAGPRAHASGTAGLTWPRPEVPRAHRSLQAIRCLGPAPSAPILPRRAEGGVSVPGWVLRAWWVG